MTTDNKLDKASCETLDARDTLCPEPIMLLHKHLQPLQGGDMLRVYATDPSTRRDIPKFCRYLRHTLLDSSVNKGVYSFLVKKRQEP